MDLRMFIIYIFVIIKLWATFYGFFILSGSEIDYF